MPLEAQLTHHYIMMAGVVDRMLPLLEAAAPEGRREAALVVMVVLAQHNWEAVVQGAVAAERVLVLQAALEGGVELEAVVAEVAPLRATPSPAALAVMAVLAPSSSTLGEG